MCFYIKQDLLIFTVILKLLLLLITLIMQVYQHLFNALCSSKNIKMVLYIDSQIAFSFLSFRLPADGSGMLRKTIGFQLSVRLKHLLHWLWSWLVITSNILKATAGFVCHGTWYI